MSAGQRIYLDNAATSFPKPAVVYDAVDAAQRSLGAAAGRSATRAAGRVHDIIERCRSRAAWVLGAERPDRIVFTFNATDGLNLALHGLLKPGDHVVTSRIEHNSVLRPLRVLRERGVDVTTVPANSEGLVSPNDVRQALRKNTRLVALMHASNVAGTVQPIEQVGEIARSGGAFFLVDASQTAGHWPIDVSRLPVDLLATAGHKGLLAPLGTGVLYLRDGMEEHVASLRQGGTGTQSDDDRQPMLMPYKYESGNQNVPGLVGLEASLAWLEERTVADACRHEQELARRLIEGISRLPHVHLHGAGGSLDRVAVISITVDGMDPQELALVLDDSFGIETRAGLHCAPGAHRCLGTFDGGGTVRLSPGALTSFEEIDAAVAAIREIAGP